MNEEEIVPLETPTEPEETVTPPAEATEDTPETPAVDVETLQATNKKLFERAKKAEADLKALKASGQTPQPNVEEVVLQANGMPDELISELKAVAKVRNTNLIKAQNDPIFVAIKEKFEKDQKTKQANVGASRSSGGVKPKKDFLTPGLSRDEHRTMVLGK